MPFGVALGLTCRVASGMLEAIPMSARGTWQHRREGVSSEGAIVG